MSPTTTRTRDRSNAGRNPTNRTTTTTPRSQPNSSYQVPVVGTTLPSGLVEKGFWGALVGSALLGALDPPLAALVGAGVIISRHRRG